MLNRRFTIITLTVLNLIFSGFVAMQYGLASLNNWLLILSLAIFSSAVYRVLGMVEGYSDERKTS